MKGRGFATLLDQKEQKSGGNTKQRTRAISKEFEEEIRTEAYYNFIKRGAQPGGAWEDWLKAEREVKRRHQLV